MIARRTLLALPPALLLAGVAGATPGGVLHWDSGYLFLRVAVNGRPADAMLDFDIATSLVDRRHAAPLGINGADRPMIEAAGRRLGPLAITLSDLTDYANFKLHGRIALILGRDFLASASWLLDLAGLSLTPLSPGGGRSGKPLPLIRRFGFETIPVTIGGLSAHAALSLRSQESAILAAAFAARMRRSAGGGASGLSVQTSTISRLDLAGRSFTNVAAALSAGDQIPDAWIGPDILRHFRIGVDLAARMLWFDPV